MFKGCKDGVHKFRPRYDVKLNIEVLSLFKSVSGSLEDLKNQIYICDVCVKCGKQTKDINQED